LSSDAPACAESIVSDALSQGSAPDADPKNGAEKDSSQPTRPQSANTREDRRLLIRYHEEGDMAAREELVERFLPLARQLARRYQRQNEPLDDLLQVASMGLVKAIDRFDPERGMTFTAYAVPTIIGELKRHFRDKGWALHVPRRLKELSLQLTQLVETLSGKLGRSPTVSELAKAAKVDEEEVIEALEIGQAYSTLSLSQGDDDSDLDPLGSIGTLDAGFEASEDRTLLLPGFKALGERERKIMTLRFFGGLTQSEIAAEVGISQMHVSRLIRHSLEKMRVEIEAQRRAGSR
jgi:RNA polymerase sigma-B factor